MLDLIFGIFVGFMLVTFVLLTVVGAVTVAAKMWRDYE